MAENAQTVYPVVRYRDAKAAIVWLVTTLGFVEHEVHPGEGDEIAHAQLAFGGGLIMLGSAREGSSIGETTVYMATADADVAYERARAAGADIMYEPYETDYGSREFGVRDPEGNSWSIGTYQPVAGG